MPAETRDSCTKTSKLTPETFVGEGPASEKSLYLHIYTEGTSFEERTEGIVHSSLISLD